MNSGVQRLRACVFFNTVPYCVLTHHNTDFTGQVIMIKHLLVSHQNI
jgi:hypothetical protein